MSEDMKQSVDFLYQTLAEITDKAQIRKLFDDLCTYKEIDSMAQRLTAASLLASGATYESIIKQTEISSATLSRVSRCLKYGEGYKTLFSTKNDK